MKYPMENNELQKFYRLHTGKESDPKTDRLLDAITEMVNDAYIEGVQEGMRRLTDKV